MGRWRRSLGLHGPGRETTRGAVDGEPHGNGQRGKNGHGGENGVRLHAGIGLDHDEAEAARGADPFADDGAKRGKRRGNPQAGGETGQTKRQTDMDQHLPMAGLRQGGGVKHVARRAIETIGKGGSDGKEDDERGHRHFGCHAEAEPEHKYGGQHKHRKGLQHQYHGPGKPPHPRQGRDQEGNARANEAADGETKEDFR